MYFAHCKTLDELKKEYRRLAMLHHPDRGGDTETMKRINAEHDRIFEILKSQHNATADANHKTTETAEEFRRIIDTLAKLDGLNIELCGSWLWISGDTRQHKDALKAAGCRWHQKKVMWYWHHPEETGRHRSNASMQEIRRRYGSELIKANGERVEYAIPAGA